MVSLRESPKKASYSLTGKTDVSLATAYPVQSAYSRILSLERDAVAEKLVGEMEKPGIGRKIYQSERGKTSNSHFEFTFGISDF